MSHHFVLCYFICLTMSSPLTNFCSSLLCLIHPPSLDRIGPNVFLNICLSKTNKLTQKHYTGCELGSSVGIATELRAGRSGIESRWGRDFLPVQTGLGAHPASCKMSTGSFPGVKCGRGVLLTTHPLLVPRSWKSRAIPLPTLWATPGL